MAKSCKTRSTPSNKRKSEKNLTQEAQAKRSSKHRTTFRMLSQVPSSSLISRSNAATSNGLNQFKTGKITCLSPKIYRARIGQPFPKTSKMILEPFMCPSLVSIASISFTSPTYTHIQTTERKM